MIVLLVVTLMGSTPAASFHNDGLPIIHQSSADGAAGFGIRVDQDATGDLVIDLETTGPATSSQISIAAGFFDQDRNLVFMLALTSHTSPDRLVVSPAPLVNVEYGPGHDGHTTIGDGFDYTFTTAATDGACTFACLGLNIPDADTGPHYFVTWAGGGSSTELTIRSAASGARATTTQGPAYVLGDPEITNGTPNVQVQQSVDNTRVGTKVIVDASYDVTAGNQVWGFWGASDFKLACQFALGACIWGSQVTYECSAATSLDCQTTKISYDSPAGGDSGRTTYGILGGAPGDYSFNVDLKVDAYGPLVYDADTGTFVLLGETFSYLTIADVELPR